MPETNAHCERLMGQSERKNEFYSLIKICVIVQNMRSVFWMIRAIFLITRLNQKQKRFAIWWDLANHWITMVKVNKEFTREQYSKWYGNDDLTTVHTFSSFDSQHSKVADDSTISMLKLVCKSLVSSGRHTRSERHRGIMYYLYLLPLHSNTPGAPLRMCGSHGFC